MLEQFRYENYCLAVQYVYGVIRRNPDVLEERISYIFQPTAAFCWFLFLWIFDIFPHLQARSVMEVKKLAESDGKQEDDEEIFFRNSDFLRTTHYNPEDRTHYSHHCWNFKSNDFCTQI
jgi:hypothetical protein